ncbi:hypothetical protein F2P81_007440 [Scophthalmus maximus]|uniref:C2 domain-containing protein n=1 Tax=Scophthalmus maximus TaxID=52904 RepID=A0A6A4THI6_SCOMX|nr:hypothetical protein F2P81_007440 [Scophthalmus maximus]
MPFSDTVKYVLLAVSVALLVLALGILAWQAFRCCTQTHAAYTRQGAVVRELLYSGDTSTTAGKYSGAPSTKVDGSLRFSVHFDQPLSRLVVHVLRVEGLPKHSQTCRLQLFVKLQLMWAGSAAVELVGRRDEEDLVGEVLLSLKFLPTAQRLEVGLLKVRTVPTEICSDAALYVKISVQCNQYKLRYQRTSVVARCLVTIFNEVLMFSLPEFPMERCKILVSVYQTRTTWKSPKQLVGQLTVGKERIAEDEHWNLMMRSVRQPVAKWHGLLL